MRVPRHVRLSSVAMSSTRTQHSNQGSVAYVSYSPPAPAPSMPSLVVGGTAKAPLAAAAPVSPVLKREPERRSKVPMTVYNEVKRAEGSAKGSAKPHSSFPTRKPTTPARMASPVRQKASSNASTDRTGSASARINSLRPGDHFEKTLSKLASQAPTAVSLNDFYRYGEDSSPVQRLRNRQFLYHELPIRIAQRVVELRSLPHGLSEKEPIRDLATMYAGYVRKLINTDRPHEATEAEGARFTGTLRSIFLEHSSVVQQMALGVLQFRDEIQAHPTATWDLEVQADIQQLLDRFYTARIGLRLLVEQYITSTQNREGYSGVIQRECKLCDIAMGAAEDARHLCLQHLDEAPEITVHGALGATFTYVPSHIYYCLTEVLKNSVRATVEHHRRQGEVGEMPAVRIVIAEGNEDMTIKVSDEGGGIRRSEMERVWTYLHSTAERPDSMHGSGSSQRERSALAGYGVGMPLSRLYAEYFGGSMDVKSMEGIGTDAYLHLNRLGHACESLPGTVRKSPGNLTSELQEVNEMYDHGQVLSSKQQSTLFYESGLVGN